MDLEVDSNGDQIRHKESKNFSKEEKQRLKLQQKQLKDFFNSFRNQNNDLEKSTQNPLPHFLTHPPNATTVRVNSTPKSTTKRVNESEGVKTRKKRQFPYITLSRNTLRFDPTLEKGEYTYPTTSK